VHELQEIWKRHKGNTRRVLFVKEDNETVGSDRTVFKTLPNLPDDEDATERDLEETENPF